MKNLTVLLLLLCTFCMIVVQSADDKENGNKLNDGKSLKKNHQAWRQLRRQRLGDKFGKPQEKPSTGMETFKAFKEGLRSKKKTDGEQGKKKAGLKPLKAKLKTKLVVKKKELQKQGIIGEELKKKLAGYKAAMITALLPGKRKRNREKGTKKIIGDGQEKKMAGLKAKLKKTFKKQGIAKKVAGFMAGLKKRLTGKREGNGEKGTKKITDEDQEKKMAGLKGKLKKTFKKQGITKKVAGFMAGLKKRLTGKRKGNGEKRKKHK